MLEKLRKESVVRKDERESRARHAVNQRLARGVLGIDALFEPESQAIETPRRGPSHERTECQSIDTPANGTESRFVVVHREDPKSSGHGNVFPVAAPLSNNRAWIR